MSRLKFVTGVVDIFMTPVSCVPVLSYSRSYRPSATYPFLFPLGPNFYTCLISRIDPTNCLPVDSSFEYLICLAHFSGLNTRCSTTATVSDCFAVSHPQITICNGRIPCGLQWVGDRDRR